MMFSFMLSKSKRIVTAAMGIMVLLVVLSSAVFLAHEADHDCAGEDCPICASMVQCEKTLHQINAGIISGAVPVLFTAVLLLFCGVSLFPAKAETPVSRKVRMNN